VNFLAAVFFYFFAILFAAGYLFALIGVAKKQKFGSIIALIIGIIDLIFAILIFDIFSLIFDIVIIILAIIEYKHVEEYRSQETIKPTQQQPTYQPSLQPVPHSPPQQISGEQSRFCPSCGAPAKGEFCPECGNKID